MKVDLERLREEPHATAADVFTLGDDVTDEDRKAIDGYLAIFFPPAEGGRCRGCERTLGGLLGTLQWGLAHGEATCSHCGLPARVYHEIKDGDGEKIVSFTLPLQYHADRLSYDKEAGCEQA